MKTTLAVVAAILYWLIGRALTRKLQTSFKEEDLCDACFSYRCCCVDV